MSFKNQTAIVTGGAQGIGGAVAELLSEHGVRVALWDMDESLANETAGRIGNGAMAAVCDVSDWDSVQQAFETTYKAFGQIDIVVNSAGIAGSKAYGRIVNIASVAGKEGNPNASAYSASKAGVIGLTKSLGKELADIDVAVNCVTPAAARTRIFDQMAQEHIDYMLSKIPRGRFLELREAADMIVWLCSKENSFTTAGVFDLSGGRASSSLCGGKS